MTVTINLDKARAITHDRRRSARAAEFAPLDDAIAKRLPGRSFEEIDAERQTVRDRYAALQVDIDGCSDADQLKAVIESAAL